MVIQVSTRPRGADDPSGLSLLDTQPIDMVLLLEVVGADAGSARG